MQTFSPIQNHILSKLKNAKELRCSDMQPEKVPNDLYNHHLQWLSIDEMKKKEDLDVYVNEIISSLTLIR